MTQKNTTKEQKMKVTSKMFTDNPNLTPREIMDKVSSKRHKSTKRMPDRDAKRREHEIKLMENK